MKDNFFNRAYYSPTFYYDLIEWQNFAIERETWEFEAGECVFHGMVKYDYLREPTARGNEVLDYWRLVKP